MIRNTRAYTQICIYIYIHAITVNLKRGHEFARERKVIYRREGKGERF